MPPPPQPAFGPTALLATTWRASGSLAGYAQQDAHECLIALLNAAHASARGSTLLKCNCIVHSTFGGLLQSDMRCPRCHGFSETVDPCLDISLGLGISPGQSTLAGCLKRCVAWLWSISDREYMLTTAPSGQVYAAREHCSQRLGLSEMWQGLSGGQQTTLDQAASPCTVHPVQGWRSFRCRGIRKSFC